MTWELFLAIVGMVSAIFSIAFAVRNNKRQNDQQTRSEALSMARIEGKLDNVGQGVDDMRVEMRSQRSQISSMDTRLARCEESVKSAHHRIDEVEGRMNSNG